MNIAVQVFIGLISLGILAVCALYPFTAKWRECNRHKIIIQYDHELSNEQIWSIRDHLSSQGLIGAVIVSGANSVHVWPPPPCEGALKEAIKKHLEHSARRANRA